MEYQNQIDYRALNNYQQYFTNEDIVDIEISDRYIFIASLNKYKFIIKQLIEENSIDTSQINNNHLTNEDKEEDEIIFSNSKQKFYKEKYLKYKNKYLFLKNKLEK